MKIAEGLCSFGLEGEYGIEEGWVIWLENALVFFPSSTTGLLRKGETETAMAFHSQRPE